MAGLRVGEDGVVRPHLDLGVVILWDPISSRSDEPVFLRDCLTSLIAGRPSSSTRFSSAPSQCRNGEKNRRGKLKERKVVQWVSCLTVLLFRNREHDSGVRRDVGAEQS